MKTDLRFALAVCVLVPAVCAAQIHVPPDPSPGNVSLGFLNPSSHLQQVYGRDGFPPILSDSAFLISGLYFRADERALPGSGSASFSDVEFRLSTTTRQPDGLSRLFIENIGLDEIIVFGRGPLNLNWSQGSFVTHIPFDRPFLYNPAAGNLLLDTRNYGTGDMPSFDAFATFGDSVSVVGNEQIGSPVGELFTFGLATLFWVDIVPIPEPSITALMLLGGLMLVWKFHRCRKSPPTQR